MFNSPRIPYSVVHPRSTPKFDIHHELGSWHCTIVLAPVMGIFAANRYDLGFCSLSSKALGSDRLVFFLLS